MSRDNIAIREYERLADGIIYQVEFRLNEDRLGALAQKAYKNKTRTARMGPLTAKVTVIASRRRK